MGETYRRVGGSAFAKHHQLRRDLLAIIIAVSENSLASPDADPLPQPAAHFERNDITIICETVH
jgi:hypothetical protein